VDSYNFVTGRKARPEDILAAITSGKK